MQFIFEYLLKLSISLAVVYLFYITVLRRLTFYNWNRWYLLFNSLLCFYIPFINVASLFNAPKEDTSVLKLLPSVDFSQLQAIKGSYDQTHSVYGLILQALPLILSAGAIILSVRLLVQYISFLQIKRKAILINEEGIKIYRVKKNIIPFSIGNSIFLNYDLQKEEGFKEVIRHEFVHVKQKHTIDILFAEILCILNWYNPFAWMIRHAIRQNLEFIADNNVLENGIDKKQYQYLLLKVIGVSQFSIAQKFNFSSLKKRIVMMNKLKSAKLHLAKFLFVLPLAAALLLAFREKQVGFKNNLYSAQVNVTDTVPPPPPPPTPPPPPPPPPPAAPKELPANVESVDVNNSVVTVKQKNGKVEKFDLKSKMQKAAFEKKYGELPLPPPPPAAPLAPPQPEENGTADVPTHPQPLIIVDERKMPFTVLSSINPNDIERIDVLKDKEAIAIYGELAQNGVIKITTKKNSGTAVRPAIVEVHSTPKIANTITENVAPGEIVEIATAPAVTVTGVKIAAVKSASPAVREVTVAGHPIAAATNLTGVKVSAVTNVKSSVDEVTVMGYPTSSSKATASSPSVPITVTGKPLGGLTANALYIIDGKEATAGEKDKLKPESIQSIDILSGAKAEKEYGDKGKNGVIKVTTKKISTT
ncbi:MAG: M56 family metallopeptidase [Ferruginibacter sp.]